jgi:hypothetical protein
LSNPFSPDGGGKEKQAVQGNGPFEPPRTFGDSFIDEKTPTWTAEKERILLGPFDYLYGHPGKDIRSQLIAAFNVWLKVPDSSLAIITKVVGMLHTASLLCVFLPPFPSTASLTLDNTALTTSKTPPSFAAAIQSPTPSLAQHKP